MKRIALSLIAASLSLGLSAQDLLRYNYTRNGYTYTGTERIKVEGSTNLYVKLGRILFSDGAPVYLLRIDVEDSTPWKMPKNAPMTINTTEGRSIILNNSATDPNLVAPGGIDTPAGKLYWNYGEYYLEESDLRKLSAGVSNMDITKRWSAEGYIKIAWKNNEFGKAVSDEWEAIKNAPAPKSDVSGVMRSLQDKGGSRLAETTVLEVNKNVSASLVYFYYAATNTEGYDLNLFVKGLTVPYGGSVEIETSDGDRISLIQEKELPAGRVMCYPEAADVKKMLGGVKSIIFQTAGENEVVTFAQDEFTAVFDKLYNALQTISIL